MGTTGRDDQAGGLTELLSAPVIKRSVMIAGHATSVSIEKPFWDAFKAIAKRDNKSINQLIAEIDEARSINLSSAIRLYVLTHKT